jgi:predicted DNA-binding transcriptional regulator YafY
MGMAKQDRLLYILNLLRSRKSLNAARLAEESGVTERTIYRDIISLSEANIPIYYDNGYKLASDLFLPPLNFNFDEYRALKLALESTPLRETEKYRPILKRIQAKVEGGLSSQVMARKRTSVDDAFIDIPATPDGNMKTGYYALIEQGINERRQLTMVYDSVDTGTTRREVDPYFIVFRRRAFYFVGFCYLRREFRTFRLDRIKELTLDDRYFVRKAGVNARTYFIGSWELYRGEPQEVKVKFTGRAARVVLSSRHHKNEKVEVLTDGAAGYRVTVSGLEEVYRWILGFGPEAEVLAPKELRERISGESRLLHQLYKAPSDS